MNRLSNEKSPYLLQHAQNPVDWYPWGEEAFAKARNEDKPLFLSIGYSTCHWCHVMAHESFEDEETAKRMNEVFINIKVDREERPDIDGIYMSVCQGLTGSGGWPLTIIMTPDKKPFFAGTYFPRKTAHGILGMNDLIDKIEDLWKNERDGIIESAENITNWLGQKRYTSSGKNPGTDTLKKAFKELDSRYDSKNGGFSPAPKFPTPHQLTFLLRYYRRFKDTYALDMVEKTLNAMFHGGIHDHVGSGFHRYSTDAKWFVPHFEKMLYDQALIAFAATETFLATGKTIFADIANDALTYVIRDLHSDTGAFFSAEDADSEGVEGKFYLWCEPEIREVLNEEEAGLWIKAYGIETKGNLRDGISDKTLNMNIPFLKKSSKELSVETGIDEEVLRNILEASTKKLLAVRGKRTHPQRDEKILTDMNGLMIAALAKGARGFDNPAYVHYAEKAAAFILGQMRIDDGGLFHRYCDGQTAIPGFLDDYAFFIWGLIELYETTFDVKYLEAAISLNSYMTEHFHDNEAGGFFFTSDMQEEVLVRKKDLYDGAIPSGNSVAALNLIRLSKLTGNPGLEDMASKIAEAFSQQIMENPSAFTQFLAALDFMIGPSHEIVITGDDDSDDASEMIRALRRLYMPNTSIMFIPGDDCLDKIKKIAPFVSDMKMQPSMTIAYVCSGSTCLSPVYDMESLKALLEQ
ncbi:MAG TPA: thioredoxin domain-containing protein [Desulfomonilia bacterium]